MSQRAFFCLTLVVLLLVGCASQQTEEPAEESQGVAITVATAEIEPRSGSNLSGVATFTAENGGVKMVIELTGAPAGVHAVHLHETGDCSAEDASSAGGHWNPTAVDHGRWGSTPYHRGDIGNLVAGEDGRGTLTLVSSEWSLGGEPDTDILGKAVIVHAGADDFTTQPTGAAGGRIGCGVVQFDVAAASGGGD